MFEEMALAATRLAGTGPDLFAYFQKAQECFWKSSGEYFDDLYEIALAKTAIPFAAFSAWFDANVIDGVIKQIESNSATGSVQIRRITTGSARDYILMAAVGMISIFVLLWGVSN